MPESLNLSLSAHELYQIAREANYDVEILEAVSSHPNVYPSLRAWAEYACVNPLMRDEPPAPGGSDTVEPLRVDVPEQTTKGRGRKVSGLPVKRRPSVLLVLLVLLVLIILALGMLYVASRPDRSGKAHEGAQEPISVSSAQNAGKESGISGTQRVLQVSGSAHTCLIMGREAQCMGDGVHGQLGDGLATSASRSTVTLPITPTLAAAGGKHTCVSDGKQIWCWGANEWGQSAPSDTILLPPTRVGAVTSKRPITSLAAGDIHTCASDGRTVWCWGSDWSGQVTGGGVQGEKKHAPVKLDLPEHQGDLRVSATRYSTCVSDTDTSWCFGANTDQHWISSDDSEIVGITRMPSENPPSPAASSENTAPVEEGV